MILRDSSICLKSFLAENFFEEIFIPESFIAESFLVEIIDRKHEQIQVRIDLLRKEAS
jgi:hypothetical protein